MADWGFRVRGLHGAAQIDNARPNFVLRSSGSQSMTLDAAWGVSPVVSCMVTVTAVNPVLAVSCAVPVTVQYASVSGTTWTFYVTAHIGTSQTLSWYLFDDAESASATVPQWGFRIRKRGDPTKTVLHSGQRVAKGVDVLTGAGAVTYTSGHAYAVAFAESGKQFTSTNIGGGTWRNITTMRGAKVSGATVTTSLEVYENYTTAFAQDGWGSGSAVMLVFDVTGL
jgi:hypothetical protein